MQYEIIELTPPHTLAQERNSKNRKIPLEKEIIYIIKVNT